MKSFQKIMADKLNEFAKQFNKGAPGGAPKGLGLGVKLLAAGAAAIYGIQQSIYTGKKVIPKFDITSDFTKVNC